MSFLQKFDTNYEEEQISIEKNKENSEQVKKFSFGVDGKFEWPIRIFTPILFGCTLLVNYLLGINKNKEVSDKFSLWVTPPGYFFAIWAVIYSGLIIANIYNLFANKWSWKTHLCFSISNILNIVWTVVFDLGSTVSVCIASFILISLTYMIFLTWVQMGDFPEENFTLVIYIMRNIFAFYLGWCIAASNLNFGMNVVYWWNGTKEQQMIAFWVMAPLSAILAFGFNLWKYGRIGLLSCIAVWLSVGWAFAGAGISSHDCLNGTC